MTIFSTQDLAQLKANGMTVEAIEQQIENFKTGFPFADIQKAATIGDGLLRMTNDEETAFVNQYDAASKNLTVYKFVPASGAASRMFKELFSFMKNYKGTAAEEAAFLAKTGSTSMFSFFKNLKDFAFYNDLKAAMTANGKDLETALSNKEYPAILSALLTENGLDYGGLPKGLLKFHKYGSAARTPLEEHLVEGANYCKGEDGKVYLHFTVSPQHREKFLALIAEVQSDYEALYDCQYVITLSEQHISTDTIAVNMDNTPFRLADGSILFRPGGHGALLQNVNALVADLVFIKNIDNVVPDRLKAPTFQFKKILGGVLLAFQTRIFEYARQLNATEPSAVLLAEIQSFFEKELSTNMPSDFEGKPLSAKAAYLAEKLNRPIRVCGMVKNEGEPGGGPFWTKNTDGTVSLQIIESAQIDLENEGQAAIMKNSSHFNPVDLACGLKNYKGEKFDLLKYSDPNTGFIAYKSQDGKELKAQELPGLWNGAMADWNTLFVEVPIETFNPVKIVQDLLRPQHN